MPPAFRARGRNMARPLFSRRCDPIKMTRPHCGPGSVFAVARGIFGVDAIGPDVPVRIPPSRFPALWLGCEDKCPARRWTPRVQCHDPILVHPKLSPLFPFGIPTGNSDPLELAFCAGQYFLDRAAAGGPPDRVMFGGWCSWVMPRPQPEIELIVGRPVTVGPGLPPSKRGANHYRQPWTHCSCPVPPPYPYDAEPTNRVVYAINNGLDTVILRLAAKAYRFVVPDAVRGGNHNVLSYLGTPVQLTNDMLEGKPRRAGDTTMRFGRM